MSRADHMPGLFGCLRKPIICVNALCCGPCLVGRQCNAVNGVANEMSVVHCIGSMLGCFNICVCCIRRKIEEKYQFGENCIVSLCIAVICPCCSLIQTQKILRRQGVRPGLVIAPPTSDKMTDVEREARTKRRDERRNRNAERRGRRASGKASSSESSSSD